MDKEEIREMSKEIVKVAKELIRENKTLADLYYCEEFPGTLWFCDCCGKLLNIQTGFKEAHGAYECGKCGYINQISKDHIYSSHNEYERKRRQRMA